MLNYVLVITSIGFSIPAIFIPTEFTSLLFFQSAVSILFWLNPAFNRNKIIHKIDSTMARTTIMIFIYNTYDNVWFDTSTIIMLWFFYLSNCYSSKNWLSRPHLISHILGHLFAINSIYIALKSQSSF